MNDLIIQDDLLTSLEPKSKFETDPRFIELKKLNQTLDHEGGMDAMLDEQEVIGTNMELLQKEIDRFAESIPMLEEQLKELKGE